MNHEALEHFERLLVFRRSMMPESNVDRLREVFSVAETMYGDQAHWTGESVLQHCVSVLDVFMQYEPDDDGMIACLLHHALDAKLWTLDDLERDYGSSVRAVVSGVHLLSHVTMKDSRMSLENLRLMFLRVSDDIRVVLLILCDHLHNLDRLHGMNPEKRRHVCHDILNLFAPVAARLGIYSLKHQLESRAFPVAYPTDSARIAQQIAEMTKQHGHFLDGASSSLELFLRQSGVVARVEGRQKQSYSIFQKMRQKSLTHVGDIYDLFALRVIVDSEASCYQTLGLLHRIGHPVANRFKDYIAFPKPNGYKSLHTTLARIPGAPDGVFVEVQIRTEEMHREADLGMAAHWSYKEGGAAEHAARRALLQRALTLQQPFEESKNSLLVDHIFALTPRGDIVELPEGSTPLDFAFHVHTALGLSFRAARVNGAIVPLTYQLENGDIVEILKHRDPHPSPNWVNLLRTASARSRLKRYLASQERPLFIQYGRDALNRELMRRKLPGLDPDLTMLRTIDGHRLTLSEREDILMKIGQGSQTASSLLSHIDLIRARITPAEPVAPSLPIKMQPGMREVWMDGGIPMPVRFARCCKPDEKLIGEIDGVIGRDGVVRVHGSTCKMLNSVNPERRIAVRWLMKK